MVSWDQIDFVFLDMDGTLLDLAFDNYFWHEYVPVHYSRKTGVQLHEAKKLLQTKYKSRAGTLEWYCIDFWSDELGLDILRLKGSIIDKVSVFPLVDEFLSELHAAGKQVNLLTNAHLGGVQIKLAKAQLSERFDRIISSHSFGHAKESAPFWPALQAHLPFQPDRTLLIDDNVQVLTAAREYGIDHLLSVITPDSTRPSQDTGEFRAIGSFADLMPIAGSAGFHD